MAELRLDITADTRDAVRGVKDVGKALDAVVDDLESVSDEGKDTGRDLERVFREVARDSKDAGHDVGREMDDGFDKAKRGADEFKDEAASTATEAAASFDGSAESIGDAFQEVAANAFAGFGPAGAVAGIAAAAGIGLAVKAFEETAEAQEASEEAIAGWADKYIEAGGRIISASQIVAESIAIATDPERYKEATENAKNWGVDEGTALRAMAGDATALAVVRKTLTARTDDYNESTKGAIKQGDGYAAATVKLTAKQIKQRDELAKGRTAWEKLTGEMEEGSRRADIVSDALLGLIRDSKEATVQVDKLGNKLVELPDGTQIVIDADTGQATQDLDEFKGDLDKIPKKKVTTVDLKVNDQATAAMERVFKNIGKKYATLTINAKFGGRTPV